MNKEKTIKYTICEYMKKQNNRKAEAEPQSESLATNIQFQKSPHIGPLIWCLSLLQINIDSDETVFIM